MKSGTIETNLAEQFLRCRVCTEIDEIPRRILRDPEQVLNLVEEVVHDHRECGRYADNPAMAKLQRDFRKRVDREMDCEGRLAAARSCAKPVLARRRCTGR